MTKEICLFDGAAGTMLWEKAKTTDPVWVYNIEKPEVVKELHREYLEAGSQIICANTFSANGPSVAPSGYTVEEVVGAALKNAHEALDGTGARIALDIGPLTGLLKPFGTISKEEAKAIFEEQIEAGIKGKPDLVFLETFMDIEMMKIAAEIVRRHDIPMFCSFSFVKSSKKKGARTMMGNSIDDILRELEPYKPDAIGVNCSAGPEMAIDVIREYSEKANGIPLIFKPNAGDPQVEGGSEFDYGVFADEVSKAAELEGVKYIGGCCGSSPKYIEALKRKIG